MHALRAAWRWYMQIPFEVVLFVAAALAIIYVVIGHLERSGRAAGLPL